MLKKILVLFAILIFSCSLALADEANEQGEMNNFVQETKVEEQGNIQSSKDKDKENNRKQIKNKIKNKQSTKTNLKKAKDFKSITECNSRAKINNITSYVSFTCENDFSDEYLERINRILENGTTIQTLRQVYDFWLTTDEDFAIVEQICAMEEEYFSEYWYENAFNKLTNYVHGELSGAEIREYQELGITTDQILAANVMCRKKGQNIHSILDNVVSGNSIEAQAKAIYGKELEVGERTLFNAVTELAKASKIGVKSLDIDEEILQKDDAFYNAVNDIIADEVAELDLSKDHTTLADDYTALKSSKYPISVQRALINKGFTPQEIEKSAEIGEKDFFKAAKKAREMLKDEK